MKKIFVSWVAIAKAVIVSIGIPSVVMVIVLFFADNMSRYYPMIVAVALLSIITTIYSIKYYKRAYSIIMQDNLLINNVEDTWSDGTSFGNWSVSISSIESISLVNASYLHLHYPMSCAKKAIVIVVKDEKDRYIRVNAFGNRQIEKIMAELLLRIEKGE